MSDGTRKTELAKDLVAPVVAFAVICAVLALASAMPTICNGVQVCPLPGARAGFGLAVGAVIFVLFVLTVIARVRNRSGLRTGVETVTFVLLIVGGILGLVLTVTVGGFTVPLII
jgi:hypothetical protein